MDQRTITADLELRAKNRTIAKLKRQGDQYSSFNKEIHYLMEPQLHKSQLVSQLRQKAQDSTAAQKLNPVSADTIKQIVEDVHTSEKINMINKGLLFKKTHEEISSGKYFLKKYDLDYQVTQQARPETSTTGATVAFDATKRKREKKVADKKHSKLMFKYF